MKPKHWSNGDFVQTAQSPAYDGSNAANRFGYCRVCKGDMQSFGGEGKNGSLLHYSSHMNYKRAQKTGG